MKNKATALSPRAQEFADVQAGKTTPGRVWIVTRRPDGTVSRRQTSRAMFKRKQAAEAATENTALPARRAMGVSQDRFAALLGISPATVRNLEQGRTKPTGPTSKLLSIAEQFPQIFISHSAKLSSRQVREVLGKVATLSDTTEISVRKARAKNNRDKITRQKPARQKAKVQTATKPEFLARL